jgi:branched-chain amino acid transport system ATP-binding protein
MSATAHAPLLRIEELSAGHGPMLAVDRVELELGRGEAVGIVGANGAGKTTLLKVLGGVHPARAGRVLLEGRDITRRSPRQRALAGLVHVPEGAQSFAPLTVEENLEVPLLAVGRRPRADSFTAVYELFPVLGRRRAQQAGTLSGGELRMLALARGLVLGPKLLILDEPTLGLSPAAAHQLAEALRTLHEGGLALLVAEQNLAFAASTTARGLLMQRGRIEWSGTSEEISTAPVVGAAVLGRGLERLVLATTTHSAEGET